MEEDGKIARRVFDLQARARDVGLVEIPIYKEWTDRKLQEGESPALISHLDATSMYLLPEEIAVVTERELEELLEDLKIELER